MIQPKNQAVRSALFLGALLLAACSNIPRLPSGTWELQWGDGKTANVDVSQLHDTEYYFRAPNSPIAGTYSVNEALEVKLIKADNIAVTGMVWHVQSEGVLKLVAEAPFEVSGVQLLPAMLVKNP